MFKLKIYEFYTKKSGNVAIITAIVVPVMMIASLGGMSIQFAFSKRQEMQGLAELACARAAKPTRMQILSDSDRASTAKALFTKMAADRKISLQRLDVSTDWLTTTVKASADIPVLENVALANRSYHVEVAAQCQSLPPYPAVGDVILSSNFTRPDGSTLPMKYGVWGVYKATEFGWEGGSGPGVEIQDWANPAVFGKLPNSNSSRYVVELDSDANSSMYRTVELHKGTYRFSLWYFARQQNAETNRISVYLEGIRPVSPKVQKLTVAKSNTGNWSYEQFTIQVDAYSLYRLTIAAEGPSDSYGGDFNDLKLEYIGRPGDHVS